MINHIIISPLSRNRFSIISALLLLIVASCSSEEQTPPPEPEAPTMHATTDIIIGQEGQPPEHQLGQPVAVRTDSQGHIYIADRLSKQIKVFDEQGQYLRSLGGRGRGPGEFQDFEFMELTPEGHLVLLDRGNLQFSIITTGGKQVATYPYNLSDQFYPQAIRYSDGKLISLFLDSSSRSQISIFERYLFHIYTTDFQQRKDSFLPFKDLGFKNTIEWVLMWHPGSFAINKNGNTMAYSPGTYTGIVHLFNKNNDESWQHVKKLSGKYPNIEPYEFYSSNHEYEKAVNNLVARATRISFDGKSYMGRQLSTDAGIFFEDQNKIIHFYTEWRNGYIRSQDSDRHKMDLYVQVLDTRGELINHDFVLTFNELNRSPRYSIVNWKDYKNRFYMIEYMNEVPVVRRFKLEFENER